MLAEWWLASGDVRFTHIFMRTSVVLLFCVFADLVRAVALDPAKPPGQNFDLSHWTLTLPVDNSGGTNGAAVAISVSQLVTGYTNAFFFHTGSDGAMVFRCPANGATTPGSTDPRTELREMLVANDSSVDWTTTGLHVLTGRCKVNAAPNG